MKITNVSRTAPVMAKGSVLYHISPVSVLIFKADNQKYMLYDEYTRTATGVLREIMARTRDIKGKIQIRFLRLIILSQKIRL